MKQIIPGAIMLLASVHAFSQTQTKDEEALRAIFTTLEKGWNAKNGEIFSSVFAPTHDYVVVNGLYFSNFSRQANAFAHQGLFDGMYKTYDIRLKVDKINFIRPELAMVHTLGAGFEKGKPIPEHPGIIMTVLAEKKDGDWKIISFHNHNLESFREGVHAPMPLNVMYASWYKQ